MTWLLLNLHLRPNSSPRPGPHLFAPCFATFEAPAPPRGNQSRHVLRRTQLVHRDETALAQLVNPNRLHLQVFALRPGPSRCIMALALLLSVQTSILNGHAVWCSSRCFTYNASMQPFVIAWASDSAEDSDTVACVTDRCRTVKHGQIANTPPDVEHIVFGSPAQSASAVTWMTSSSFPTEGKFSTHR